MRSPGFTHLLTGLFRDRGRGEPDPATGLPVFDCWGLVMAAHTLYGVLLPDMGSSCFDARRIATLFSAELDSGRWVRLASPAAPCVVAIRNNPKAPDLVNHFGTYMGHGEFLHILEDQEGGASSPLVSNVDAHPWRRRIEGYWRWTG